MAGGRGERVRRTDGRKRREGSGPGRDERSDARGRGNDELLTPGEVARLFGVNPKTITRWATTGKLDAVRTLGGHRRYRASEVYELLDGSERPQREE